jgi:hypothetical protein
MLAVLLGLVIASQNAAPAPPRADTRTWYQAYADGKRAFDQQNWQAAVDSFEASKRARAPKPGRKIPFYGDVYDDYLPDYYLGLAYVNLKQYAQAERAFAAVRASGVIGPRDREYAQLQSQENVARAALQTQTPAQNAAATPAAGSGAGTPPANAIASNTPPPGTAPAPPANLTVQQQPAANQPTPGLAGSTQPNPLPVQTPPVQTSAKAPGIVPPGSGRSAAALPPRNVPVQTRPTLPPPADPASNEREAIRLYFSGQYADAAARLAQEGNGASPRGYFYLACSRVALAILGQGGQSALDDARSMLGRAGNPQQFAQDRRYVSPRVLRLLGLNP